MGGTGANSIMLFFGDALWFSDQNGNPLTPLHNQMTPFGGPVDEIENPNPQPGTNNWWIQDGYGGFGSSGSSTGVYGGGSYVKCADAMQPGVQPILTYLSHLTPAIKPNCEANHYYLVNNYNPGYFGDGSNAYADTNPHNTPFTIPGVTQHSIADVLLANNVSWKSYNDQWDRYLSDPYQQNYGKVGPQSDQYCNICNGFQYQKQIMTDQNIRTAAGGVFREAERMGGRPSGFFEVGSLRRVRPQDCGRCAGQAGSVGQHRDLCHHGRGRRLLRLGLRPATGFFRRRHADSAHRGFALHEGGTYLAQLLGPRFDPQVH
jgi:hypothetical protein